MPELKAWMRANATLVYFLIAQAMAIVGVIMSMTAYMVRLETRVQTLEVRGSPHLSDINTRLTVLEGKSTANQHSIERIVDVMTKELHVSPTRGERK